MILSACCDISDATNAFVLLWLKLNCYQSNKSFAETSVWVQKQSDQVKVNIIVKFQKEADQTCLF